MSVRRSLLSAVVAPGVVMAVAWPAWAEATRCSATSPGRIEVQRLAIPSDRNGLEAVSISVAGNGVFGVGYAVVAVYRANDCRELFHQTFEDASEAHFELRKLGTFPVLVVTAIQPGASGDNFRHLILQFRDDRGARALAPMSFEHSNMGGFFVGDLGAEQGPGVAVWDAIWEDGAHYAPHRYRLTQYRWRPQRQLGDDWHRDGFIGPIERVSSSRLPAEPEAAARGLHLGFGDITHRERFTLTAKIVERALLAPEDRR